MTSHAHTVTPTPDPLQGRGRLRFAVENIVKKYGDFEAVKGVNFDSCRGRDLRVAGAQWRGQEHTHPHDDDADSGDERARRSLADTM